MSWFKLDDGFFRHRKARAAGKDGRALFIAGGCYSAAQLTDGFIADHDLSLVAAEADVRGKPIARRLVEVGLWEPVLGGWRIHDYHDFNPAAEAELQKRRQRSEAGRRGGAKSRPPGSKPEAKGQAEPEANGKQNGTPSPSPPEELSYSSRRPVRPDDDETLSNHEAPSETWAHYADLKFARQPPGKVDNAIGWKLTTADNARTEHGATAARWWADYDVTPRQLAERLIDGKAPANVFRRPRQHPDIQETP